MKIIACILSIVLLSYSFTKKENSLPSIKITNLKNESIFFDSLFKSKDSITVVSFWATWCAPCVKEIDAFTEKLEEWQKEKPIKLIGISVDDSRTANRVKSFVKGKGWDFDIYQDINNDLKRALNITNVPHTIVVKNNAILFHTDGYVPGNEDEILEKIKEAENPKPNSNK